MTMVRKQIYIERRHEHILKRLAEQHRVSEAQLIRDAIDASIERNAIRSSDHARNAAWTRFIETRDTWLRRTDSARQVEWKRDDLYEGRLFWSETGRRASE